MVDHGEPRLYEYLRRNLASVGGVKVITDRRQVERRRQQRPVEQERRTLERRIYRGEVSAMGYIVVRFGRRKRGDAPPAGP